MRLTSFTDYALRIMLLLTHKPEGLLTIAEVSELFGISEAHLMKVTHTLGKTGWVETVRGRNGGMRLRVDAERLRLDEVVRTLEGEFIMAECFDPAGSCVLTGRCGLESALAQARDAFYDRLAEHSLASLTRATRLPKIALRKIPIKA
jgi:Rrf2 family transcriptional regulator, nitric oxide-sensitive transcriptional repressor